jgi:hypothetical protein
LALTTEAKKNPGCLEIYAKRPVNFKESILCRKSLNSGASLSIQRALGKFCPFCEIIIEFIADNDMTGYLRIIIAGKS